MRGTAVIGANFGDEGKGLMTDYFSTNDTLVVRYNGGAQAGHTVVTPERKRHVFSHFGSGSFAGAATFLSKHFIINPMLWKKELAMLEALGLNPKVYFDNEAFMTLPYDMLINQEIERSKGDKRHGSCGYGINETVNRCLNCHKTTANIVNDTTRSTVRSGILNIRDTFCAKRIEELGLKPDKKFFEVFNSEALLDNFIKVLEKFTTKNISIFSADVIKKSSFTNVVFEGAQGLLLDEDHEFFPHVTRSKTGLKNVLSLCEEMNISGVDAVYVTRAYMTRHGRGPFPSEDKSISYKDKTNIPNEFQESLRFGRLDVDRLAMSIDDDLQQTSSHSVNVIPKLAITHVDQVPSDVAIDINGKTVNVNGYDDLVRVVATACKTSRVYVSTGTNRTNVVSTLVGKKSILV